MKHNKYLKMIRPGDIIIIVLLLAASFIPYLVFARQQAKAQGPSAGTRVLTAYVTHDGKQVYKIRLTGHRGTSRYHYQAGSEYNDIVTTGDQIQIIDANCPDQVCVKKRQDLEARSNHRVPAAQAAGRNQVQHRQRH